MIKGGPLADEIAAAEAALAALQRAALHATCAELGCIPVSTGGANCGCIIDGEPGQCSVPVHHCSRCGDCDYGENEEARMVRRKCAETRQ